MQTTKIHVSAIDWQELNARVRARSIFFSFYLIARAVFLLQFSLFYLFIYFRCVALCYCCCFCFFLSAHILFFSIHMILSFSPMCVRARVCVVMMMLFCFSLVGRFFRLEAFPLLFAAHRPTDCVSLLFFLSRECVAVGILFNCCEWSVYRFEPPNNCIQIHKYSVRMCDR